jgi:tRNA A-37 threonylcarbamoyl transferase component Bud32
MSPSINIRRLSRPPFHLKCREDVPRVTARRWLEEEAEELLGGDRAFRASGEPGAFVKPDRSAPWKRLLRSLVGRGSKARRAFELGLELERAGVNAVRPLALIEERRAGCVRRSCVLVEALEASTLRDFLLERSRQEESGTVPPAVRRAVLRAVAVEVARLHGAGARQRDLKAPNVLVAARGGRLEVTLADLEGMTLLRRAPGLAVRARDLARLAVSLREKEIAAAGIAEEDWRGCIAAYLEAAAGAPPDAAVVERFVAATLSWAARKEERNRRRGRVTH